MTHAFSLQWTDDNGNSHAFITPTIEWGGEHWNGFPAIQLPKWVAYTVDLLISQDINQTPPSISADDEADLVWCDGLTWERARCRDCGMLHTAEHSCEAIDWYADAS
jgi:hypothetical protein